MKRSASWNDNVDAFLKRARAFADDPDCPRRFQCDEDEDAVSPWAHLSQAECLHLNLHDSRWSWGMRMRSAKINGEEQEKEEQEEKQEEVEEEIQGETASICSMCHKNDYSAANTVIDDHSAAGTQPDRSASGELPIPGFYGSVLAESPSSPPISALGELPSSPSVSALGELHSSLHDNGHGELPSSRHGNAPGELPIQLHDSDSDPDYVRLPDYQDPGTPTSILFVPEFSQDTQHDAESHLQHMVIQINDVAQMQAAQGNADGHIQIIMYTYSDREGERNILNHVCVIMCL